MLPALGFAVSAALIVYVLAGYPLLLHWLARHRGRPVRRGRCQPDVAIIVAVHNGEAFLERKLESILALRYPRELMDVLVVSDGSTDATEAIARRFAARGVRLLTIPRSGKPAAVNAGIAATTGEIVVLTDVRQELDPDSLALLLENFADAEVGAASAELVIRKGNTLEEASVGLYWRYEVWIRLNLSRLDSIFGATGSYYAVRRELAVPIPAGALLDDMYLPLAGFFAGRRLIVDERARMYDYPTGLRSEFRRKVRTLAGNYQILRAYPKLLGPGNRLLLHFVSYKLARLALPFVVLALLCFSLALPWPWAAIALGAQAGFYALAAADGWVSEGSGTKRLTSPARTFVTLMAASACAVSILFVPGGRLWKQTQVSGVQAAAGPAPQRSSAAPHE